MDVLGRKPLRRVLCLKQYCGFSAQARNGTCCRRASRSTNRASALQTWCRDEVLSRVLTDVANELRDGGALNEEECCIDATFVVQRGGGFATPERIP